jgi:pyruvate,water dikinase
VRSLRVKDLAQETADAERSVREQTAKIRAAVPEQHRAEFDEILDEARKVNRLRDERSYWSDLWASGILRHAVREAGRRVAARGRIKSAEHLLDATSEEILGLLTNGARGKAVSAEELERRYHFRESVSVEDAPQFVNGTPSPPPPLEWFPEQTRRTMRAMNVALSHIFGFEQKESEDRIVRGIAVSSGQYEGRARVIDKVEDLSQLEQGEVLVTRATSTSFNYVLPRVGAIVTDRGGLMSHAAIVAREYGLPAVVGCQVATRNIPNGAMVRVDAEKGEVVVLS